MKKGILPSSPDEKTMLLQLREAARTCSNVKYRLALQMVADELAGRIAVFADKMDAPALTALNGTWANATRLLADLPPEGSPDPTSGDADSPIVEQRRMAA
jgi:hypothetical protein